MEKTGRSLPDAMASKPRCFYTHSLALAFFWVLISASPGDSGVVKTITAVVGQSVTFECPWNQKLSVERLYIQKKDLFIDGFYIGRQMKAHDNRTEMNVTALSMKMRDVTLSDEGVYTCVVFYKDHKGNPYTHYIKLTVTAKFSVPTLMSECEQRSDNFAAAGARCRLSCAAVGGYRSNVTWEGLNDRLISDDINEDFVDNQTKTWSVNQSLIYTCDRPTNVSCSIGGATSQSILICNPEDSPLVVIVASVVLVLVLLIVSFVMLMKRYCRSRSDRAEDRGEVDIPLAHK